MMRTVATSLAALMIGTPALCQDAIGETDFAGRKIVLHDDGSWQYAATEPAVCTEIDTAVQWCGTSEQWSRRPGSVTRPAGVVFGDGAIEITSQHVWPAVRPSEIASAVAKQIGSSATPTEGAETQIKTPLGAATYFKMPSATAEGALAILPLKASDVVLLLAAPKGTSEAALLEAASSFFEGVDVIPGLYLKVFGNG